MRFTYQTLQMHRAWWESKPRYQSYMPLSNPVPILPSTVSYARLLLVTILKGELISKPGHRFNWGDPWNQRTKSSKMIYWRILWINRSEIHAGIFTGKGFPQRSVSLCVLSGCDYTHGECRWLSLRTDLAMNRTVQNSTIYIVVFHSDFTCAVYPIIF